MKRVLGLLTLLICLLSPITVKAANPEPYLHFVTNNGASRIKDMPAALNKKMSYYNELPVSNAYGYSFVRWTNASKSVVYTNDTIVTQDMMAGDGKIDLFAEYKPIESTVTFDAKGGECSTSSKIVTFDSTYGSLPVPTKHGYIFVGWSFGDVSSTIVKSDDTVTIVGNKTMYAQWKGDKRYFTLESNGGVCTKNEVGFVVDDTTAGLVTPTKIGHTFKGWEIDGQKIENGMPFTLNEYDSWGSTIEATWEVNTYKVSYDLSGGEFLNGEPMEETYTYGENYNLPNPVKEGYTFVKWYSKTEGYEDVNDGDPIYPTDIELMAIYKALPTTIVQPILTTKVKYFFEANGGECSETKRIVEQKTAIGELPIPTRKGYTFEGWYTDAVNGTKIDSEFSVDEPSEVKLFAHWRKITNTATGEITPIVTYLFDSNGGDCYEVSREVPIGEPVGYLPFPVKEGYDFVGWFTKRTDGEQVEDTYVSEKETEVIFYAHWKKKKVEVPATTETPSSPKPNAFPTETPTIPKEDYGNNDLTPVKVDKVSGVKLKNTKKKLKITFKKVYMPDVKYQVQYSTSKSFKKAKSVYGSKNTVTIKPPKKKKTYYVRVRAYKKYNGMTSYGKWSSVKHIKIKK